MSPGGWAKKEYNHLRLTQLDHEPFGWRAGNVGAGMCVLDRDLRYQYINPWLAKLNGLTVRAHLGRTIMEVLPHVGAGVEAVLRRVLKDGKPEINGIVEAVTPAFPSEKRTFQHDYHAVKCAAGLIVGVRCIVQDITRRAG